MNDFIYTIWFIYKNVIWWDGRKIPEINKRRNKGKKFPVWLPSHPPVYEVEADCFPVSENTENKLDLS